MFLLLLLLLLLLKGRNHQFVDSSIDNGKWLETKLFQEKNVKSLQPSCKVVSDVPLILRLIGRHYHHSTYLPYSTMVMFIIIPLNP